MIEFDEKFFQGEERDGFYVEGEMKRAWAAEMEVLMEVDRICRKHNIPYFADSGTLLGAVRHNGFVPWDDDIDIAMLREDFMKFIRVAKTELEPPMLCLNIYHQEGWMEPFGRVINAVGGIKLTEEHLQRYHGCPYSVGVDIFVLDELPSTQAAFEVNVELAGWMLSIAKWIKEREEEKEKGGNAEEEKDAIRKQEEEKIKEQICRLEELCNVKLDWQKNLANQLLKLADGLFAMAGEDGNGEVMNMAYAKKAHYYAMGRKKEWYRESVRLPFENITIPVPVEFYKVLEKSYGPDYLRPVKKWHFHDYPFYKENKRRLKEAQKDVRSIQGKINKLEELLKKEGKEGAGI